VISKGEMTLRLPGKTTHRVPSKNPNIVGFDCEMTAIRVKVYGSILPIDLVR